MDAKESVRIKVETTADSSVLCDETNSCIDEMVQEMQNMDRAKQAERTATVTNQSMQSEDHDESAFYNIHSVLPKTLKMRTGESDIVLEPKLASRLYNGSNLQYDRTMLNRADVWHQVIVHHENGCSKAKILETLFNKFTYSDFFPVAYRRHVNVDFFLLRMCNQVMMKMFEEGLTLKFGQEELALSIRLGAARFQTGQIFPRQTITKAVQERCDNAAQYGSSNLLNLDSFAEHVSLQELCVNLCNRAQFEVVCSAIVQVLNDNSCINTLRLSNNGISHISVLSSAKHLRIVSLDLRGNRIKHPSSLRGLREMPLLELYVLGNNLIEVPGYEKVLHSIFPELLKLDTSLTNPVVTKIVRDIDEEEEEVEITSLGTLITEADMNVTAFQKYNLTPHWHKITVLHNGVCNKQDILDALFNLVGKHTFFPCYYKTYSKEDEFLVQNCFDALLVLVRQKLKLPMPAKNAMLKLTLTMNVAEAGEKDVQPLKKLEWFVGKRFHQTCLDLCSMQTDLNKCKFVDFCAKSPATMRYIMEYAARRHGNVCLVLRLRNNELRNCEALESLSKFYSLVSLDLRHNMISKFTDLKGIPWNNIKALFLDNNPVCSTVHSSVEYVRNVKQFFGGLKQLDGKPLLGNFALCQNYICVPEAYKFAESFVMHYFTLFDSFQRADLQELYHPKAQFSMTCDFEIDTAHTSEEQMNSQQLRQANYIQHSRNLLKFKGNLKQAISMLIVGNERIGYVLTNFPKTEFDFHSFCIDVPVFTPERVLITVNGRMQEDELSTPGQNHFLGFTRTWLLQPSGMGTNLFHEALEYKIHNDMLHMYDMVDGKNESFGNSAEASNEQESAMDATSCDSDDRENALIVFMQLTKLNTEWSKRCLEESSWNLKVALNVFLKLYESKRIPKIAFKDDIL
ncbi:nuclear RNA export factor 2 [Anopheles maculipalpis]|uniref:nuclear RNA export factor 2 n=1 Tax=Anopheles maculipalpis TaxID=1496333 RepID=UPI002158B71F|nr:nuclear RNA export factor 2 [Anopheles maculipalpis]